MSLKHFSLFEFDEPNNLGSGKNMDKEFLQALDKAREGAKIPFSVVRGGGWRSVDYQKEIYRKLGKPPVLNSFHLKGRAADIAYKSEGDLKKIIKAAYCEGIRGFGINRGAIHLDNRERLAIWGYSATKQTALFERTKSYINSLTDKDCSKKGLFSSNGWFALALLPLPFIDWEKWKQ